MPYAYIYVRYNILSVISRRLAFVYSDWDGKQSQNRYGIIPGANHLCVTGTL